MSFLWLLFLSTFLSTGDQTKADTGVIPFEFIRNKVIITVEIEGDSFRFLVDTGGIFEISEAVQKRFNFPELGTTTITDINKKELDIKTVTVPLVKIGNWTFINRKAIVSDVMDEYPYGCFELDGMIGRDFFENTVLQFDLSSKSFRMSKDHNSFQFNKSRRTKMKLGKGGLPYVQLEINGKKEYVVFDAGSGDFYSTKTSISRTQLDQDPNAEILEFEGIFSYGITMDEIKSSTRYRALINSLELAGSTYKQFYSEFSKTTRSRLGAGILEYGSVTMDYKNDWFYFEPFAKQKDNSFESFGFDVTRLEDSFFIKWVLKNSPADKLGLKYGDTILEIDNIPPGNQMNCNGYLYGYEFQENDQVNIKYQNELGEIKEVQLDRYSID